MVAKFGEGGGFTATASEITPLKKRIIVKNMHFGESKTAGGIIMLDDDGKEGGIHPRWGQVHAVGKDQTDVAVGQWVMVAHGRWTRTFIIENENEKAECRMIDENDILLVSDEAPGEANTKMATYNNMGGAWQMESLPGND